MRQSTQFSSAELRRLQAQLDPLQKDRDPQDVLLDNADFLQRFKISRRTAYNWRRKKLLKHLLIEKKIFYRLSDVRKFLEEVTK